MLLSKQAIEPVPEDTAKIAHQASHPYIRMRDLLGIIYTDDVFAALYPPDGQPAIRPWRLALVTVMQFTENLTDRQEAPPGIGTITCCRTPATGMDSAFLSA